MMTFLWRRQERKGSALIITILIVSVISTISFMVSALAISEFRKAGTLQDSIAAYYAAESGIEQGLLQYRLWHDAELSEDIYKSATTGVPRKDVNDTSKPQQIKLAANDSSKYDLKMWFKGTVIGKADQSGNPSIATGVLSPQIQRDSALQIAGANAKRMQLTWAPVNPNGVIRPGQPRYFVEVTATGLKSGQQQTERTVLKDTEVGQQPATITFGLDTVQTIRVKPWDMGAMRYNLALQDSSNNHLLFDNQVSYIESTGTVGRAKRTLKIGIDRASGTGLESQDFVLYSGDNPILLQ